MIETKLAKKAAFPGKAKAAKTPVDLSGIVRCNDPYQPERVIKRRKYDEKFKGLKEGDCFRLPGASVKEVGAFSRAMREYMKRNGIDGIVRQSCKTDDGIPRVWLLRVFNKELT